MGGVHRDKGLGIQIGFKSPFEKKLEQISDFCKKLFIEQCFRTTISACSQTKKL